ncbi:MULTISPECIES: hypothetical protein [Streptomyces]|uniref:DUF7848 domain-containing protein n=1 Tax=Streptomyces TaxID=1883 RepID=UPI001424B927|nr:hypothetical protein [Streptomyces sp. AgN23]AJZ85894.1 hypothetical protein AS97_34965 [Streptomyces sp. AgN23]WTA85669.1 hypothetical protein OG751_40665 [Streptomyces antimycoticus]
MTRATYRFREFQLIPDTESDAEPLAFAVQCAVCEQSGEPSEDQAAAHTWATGHLRANGEHYTYREIITRPCRFEPGAWQ